MRTLPASAAVAAAASRVAARSGHHQRASFVIQRAVVSSNPRGSSSSRSGRGLGGSAAATRGEIPRAASSSRAPPRTSSNVTPRRPVVSRAWRGGHGRAEHAPEGLRADHGRHRRREQRPDGQQVRADRAGEAVHQLLGHHLADVRAVECRRGPVCEVVLVDQLRPRVPGHRSGRGQQHGQDGEDGAQPRGPHRQPGPRGTPVTRLRSSEASQGW